MATRQAVNNTRATTPVSVPIITRIQVEGNDTVSFLYGTTPPYQYVRGMSQIMTQNPAYISYRYDTITISQVAGESFTFTIYSITDVGGNTFTALTSQDPSDVVAAKTQEIYRLLVTSVFKGCCECGNTEPECSIQYTAGDSGAENPGIFVDGGSAVRFNYFTANNQDFTGFWPIVQDGSWVFIFSKTDPTVYGVYQLSNYSDGGAFAQFDSTLITGPAGFPAGTSLCVDVTSVGGSLVQDWQDTLNISSLLTQDNLVDGGGFNFEWENVNRYIITSSNYQSYLSTDGFSTGQVYITPGSVSITGTTFIDVITPNYASATAGMVLALDASGHVEYTLAGTGTISSIGLFMPPAFTVSTPNPLIANGDFTVTGAGTDLEYINGLGELATLPVYTVENGLHVFGAEPGETPANPLLFHLGGVLIEDTVITVTDGTDEYVLGVSGTANQDTRRPFSASNLGQGGTAVFLDYGSGARPNPTVEIFGNTDTYRPLLELELNGPLPNPGDPGIWENRNSLLSLINTGTTSVGARMAIDYKFRNTSVSPNPDLVFWPAVKLIAEATSVIENDETSNFSIRMFDGGSQQDKLLLEGKGQLTLNEYGAAIFTDGTTNINNALTYNLAVDGTGKVWKKLATGGGSVSSVSGTGLITTSPNPITTTGTVTTSVNENRLVGRWDLAGTGIMQEITLGTNLDLTALGVLNASGGGFDVQVNSATIIPPATILNLKSGTGVDVVHEGSGSVRFDLSGTPPTPGLQDVIIEDNVLTQNNTIQGSLTSFVWKSNSFYEINPTVNYDPGTGSVPGYFRAFVGKYPPSYSELYVEAIYAQMKSEGATDQIVKVDTTGVYVQTPGLGSATVGQVLTLQNATTGQVEYQDAGGDPSPLTTKGDLYTFDTADARLPVGTDGQILYADSAETTGLKWGDAPTGGGGGGGRSYYLNGSVVQGTFAGITDMRQMSPVPIIGVGTDFTISSNGYIKSFITDAGDPNKAVIPAGNWNFELWFSANNGGGSPSFYVELYKYDTVALTFTLISSSSANPAPITNGTTISLYLTALSVPQTTLALTDRLAVRVFVNNSGRTITLHTQGPHLSQIITDFPSGIVSLNGLTAFSQTFATPGTTGTAPNWDSLTSIHTLNIPFASASGVTAGLISKTEYDTFNGKVAPTRSISTTAPLTGGGDLSADRTLSIPLATNSVDGYLSAADRTAFNAKQDAITGAATTITTADLTVDRALISNASGKVAVSSSTVGYSLATLTDPNAITYLRVNANNSVTARTPAQVLTDLGVSANIILNRNFADTSNVGGVGNQIVYTVLIPANTLQVNDWINLKTFVRNNGASATGVNVYVNTTPTIPIASIVTIGTLTVAANNGGLYDRNFMITSIGPSGVIKYFQGSALSAYTPANFSASTGTINTTIDLYLVFAAAPPSGNTFVTNGNIIQLTR
jgi:hypothetical protein